MTIQAGVLNIEFFSAKEVYFIIVGRSFGVLFNISLRIVKNAVTNSCSHFHANAAISAHPAIRSVLWSLESGFGVSLRSLTCEEVLKGGSTSSFCFSIPKILRRYFLYDRKLFSELTRCAWETLKEFFKETVPEKDAVPGAVIAIHTFGDFLGWHPHLHVLCTDGCFYGNGMFRVAQLFEIKHLEEIFRHKVFKLLLKKEKITAELVKMVAGWIDKRTQTKLGSPNPENIRN